jgi:predicted phage baseplate assembly protein
MALPVPNLDDRDFQGLVDDAKRIVQQRCPEWTDHNISDPGVTLIETFAWMTEQLIYRLNRVPDRNYIKFLELIGVTLFPPTAARTDVTFWLSGPQPELVTIPSGTQVATLRTETEEAVVFGTVADLPIVPASVTRAGSMAKTKWTDLWDLIRTRQDASAFQAKPVLGDALAIGLSEPVPSNVIRLRFKCRIQGVGVDPDRPPLVWEAWTGDDWERCVLDSDTTGGLNRDGDVVLHVPRGHALRALGGHDAAWVRARVVEPQPGARAYQSSPTISSVSSITIGGTVEAENAVIVHHEDLGSSEGVPGQRFQLRRFPVLGPNRRLRQDGKPGADEELGLDVSTGFDATGAPIWERWRRVDDFADSKPSDRHYVLDAAVGEVRLGPAVRQEDGAIRRYGATPEKDRRLRMVEYRTGGGARGNVAAGSLRVMKSSIPFVASVENLREARGGVDGEDIENAKTRGPIRLRTRARAVTTEDYEEIAREAAPQAGRVRAVSAGEGAQAGSVRLQVVPSVGSPEGRIAYEQLVPDESLLRTIRDRLEECRVIGTQLNVERVGYTGVLVMATVRAAQGMDPARVKSAAERALFRYINPLAGGPDGRGWPFGRPVTMGEVYAVLQRVPGVELIESLELFGADAESGANRKKAERVEVSPNGLVFSLDHVVNVPGADGAAA